MLTEEVGQYGKSKGSFEKIKRIEKSGRVRHWDHRKYGKDGYGAWKRTITWRDKKVFGLYSELS